MYGKHEHACVKHTGGCYVKFVSLYCIVSRTDVKHVNMDLFGRSMKLTATSKHEIEAALTRWNEGHRDLRYGDK